MSIPPVLKALRQTIDVIRLKSFSQLQLATVSGLVVGTIAGDSEIWSILSWLVVNPIASGVYGVDASMRVDLEYTDLEYTELVLTAELLSMSF